jgi:DNA-binding NtrC family response regulator
LTKPSSIFRIFIIDDERAIASTTSVILHQAGFEATPFSNPTALLEACRESPPDLVISDIIMPEMDGFELATRLQENHPECKVILFTGQAGVDDLRDMAHEKGLYLDVLSKPVHPKDLILKVRKVTEVEA